MIPTGNNPLFSTDIDILTHAVHTSTDFNVQTEHGMPALFHIASFHDYELLRLALQHGVDPDTPIYGDTLLWYAVRDGDIKTIELLIEFGASLGRNPRGKTPLHALSGTNAYQVAQILINHGAPCLPDYASATPLSAYLEDDKWDIPMLIFQGCPRAICAPEVKDLDPLIRKSLVYRSWDIDPSDPSMVAMIATGDLDWPVPPKAQLSRYSLAPSPSGLTPLLAAVLTDNYLLADHLLSMGSDPNQVDRLGNSALYYASERELGMCETLLLEYGADPAITNRHGISAALLRFSRSNPSLCQELRPGNRAHLASPAPIGSANR
jgi:ankyrin repeat protein